MSSVVPFLFMPTSCVVVWLCAKVSQVCVWYRSAALWLCFSGNEKPFNGSNLNSRITRGLLLPPFPSLSSFSLSFVPGV